MKTIAESFQNTFTKKLENDYNKYISSKHLQNIRIAYSIFSFLYALFAITDYLLVPEYFSLFFAIRFYIVIPAFMLTVVLSFSPIYFRWEQLILLAGMIIGGTGIAVMLVLKPSNSIYYGGLFLVLTAGYYMIHLRTCYAVAGGISILTVFVTGVFLTGTMSLGVFSGTLFLLAENIMGGFGAYQLEQFRRNEYLKIRDLNQSQAKLETAMVERNRYLETILQTSADGFMVVNAGMQIVQVNNAYCRMSGYSQNELQRMSLADIDNDETVENIDTRMHRIIANGNEIFETRHRRKDGSVFNVEVSVTHLDIGSGQLICFCRDSTNRKQAEDRIKSLLASKELLLKELHHRIKNNLVSVSNLLDLQSQSYVPEARSLFKVAINRVNSMVVLYDKLLSSEQYESLSCKSFLLDIINRMASLFPDMANVKIETQMDNFDLSPKKLFPLGIIVNELITNIMKYAFIGKESGHVYISLIRTDDIATLTVQDNGIGLPEGFDAATATGFGLMLVGMLAEQLGGSFALHNDAGTRNVVSFSV